MWLRTPMTRSEWSILVTPQSVKSLPCSTPLLIPRSQYLRDFELRVYLDSIPIHRRFHQCSGYSRNPRFRRIYSHSTCFVLWIERDWYHSKSPSDPSILAFCVFLRSEDCQPEQQSACHNNHWRSHDSLLLIGGRHLYPNDNPIRLIDVPVPRYGKHYHATESRVRTPSDHRGPSWRRSCTILSHSISVPSRPCHTIPISCCTTSQPTKWKWSMLLHYHGKC